MYVLTTLLCYLLIVAFILAIFSISYSITIIPVIIIIVITAVFAIMLYIYIFFSEMDIDSTFKICMAYNCKM